MKTPGFIVRIPEPCHESWEGMQPDNTGRYCGSCQKSVVDFTGKTDTEIRDLLLARSGEKVCGHFKKTQVDRPLNFTVQLSQLPRNLVPRKAFALALLLVFGTSLFSCYDHRGKKVNGIEVKGERTDESTWTTGEPAVEQRIQPNTSGEQEQGTLPEYRGEVALKGDTIVEDEIMGDITIPWPQEVGVKGDVKLFTDGAEVSTGLVESEIPEDFLSGNVEGVDTLDAMGTKSVELITMGSVAYEAYDPGPDTSQAEVKLPGQKKPASPDLGETGSSMNLYPNPSKGMFTVEYTLKRSKNMELYMVDEQGRLAKNVLRVAGQHSGTYRIPVDLYGHMPGIYFAILMNGDTREVKKMILE